MADIVLINKVDSADWDGIAQSRDEIRQANPRAIVVEAASPVFVDDPAAVAGKRVLVIEDGPTVTHGSMPYGAGAILATKLGAAELVDPRPYAVGSIAETYAKYDHLEEILPAMGYGEQQMEELRQTIEATPCDLVLAATPTDVVKLLKLKTRAMRVRYELQELGRPSLEDAIRRVKPNLL